MGDPSSRLLSLAKQLGTSSALDVTLKAVVDCAVELLGVSQVSIRLIDPEDRTLVAISRAGQPLHRHARVTYEVGEGLLGWIASEGQPLRSGDAMADERFVPRPDMVTPMGSFIGVPVLVAGRVIGVLSATAAKKDVFTAENEDALLKIAGIAAPYVEAARKARKASAKT